MLDPIKQLLIEGLRKKGYDIPEPADPLRPEDDPLLSGADGAQAPPIPAPQPGAGPALPPPAASTATLPPAAPPKAAPGGDFGAADAIAVGLSGMGDAMNASAGRTTTAAKNTLETIQAGPAKAAERAGLVQTAAAQAENRDPNSTISKFKASIAAKYTGQPPEAFSGVNGEQIDKIFPTIEKAWQAQQSVQEKKYAADTAAQTHTDMMKMNEGWKEAMFGDKQDARHQKQWTDFQKLNDPTTGTSRTVIGQLGSANLKADRAINQIKNNPNLTTADLGNITADIAGIYGGGAPTDIGMKHQNYDTLYGKVQQFKQFVSGIPQGAVPDAIRQRLAASLADLKNTNSQIIKAHNDQLERSNKWLTKDHPDEWKEFRAGVEGSSAPSAAGGQADGGAAKPPAAGEVVDGYTFKGGDPSNPKNWEKM